MPLPPPLLLPPLPLLALQTQLRPPSAAAATDAARVASMLRMQVRPVTY